jgi:hypothetical protein
MADPTLPSEEELRELEHILKLRRAECFGSMFITLEEGEKLIASARTVRRVEALRQHLERCAYHMATEYERGRCCGMS